jgi:opacity protein-like surface antigen
MNSLIKAVALAVVIAAPVASFAQSNQPVTRAEVRADLARVEQAGYDPRDWVHYPENIQAAEARVSAQQGNAAYGAGTQGASQSGQRADETRTSYSVPVEGAGLPVHVTGR